MVIYRGSKKLLPKQIKGDKTMNIIKNANYKSCHIQVERDAEENEYNVVVTDANNHKWTESFATELEATQWALSKAEWCDRQSYDYKVR